MRRARKARILDYMKRIWVVIILVLAFCGLANSFYLSQHEKSGVPLLCTTQNLSGCNTVANSPYSHLFGIPLADYGVFFYGIVFVLAALEILLFDQFLRRALQGMALVGVLASVYFTAVQIYFIGAFCTYCAVSTAIALLVLICASFIEPLRKSAQPQSQTSPLSQPSLTMPPVA